MYAVMGITGQVGGAVADTLLQQGKSVRGIVRNIAKASKWQLAGVELAVADNNDAEALQRALQGVEGAFVMIPPNFAPGEGYPEARAVAGCLRTALIAAKPPRLVALSSIGAQHSHGLGLITQLHILEEALANSFCPV